MSTVLFIAFCLLQVVMFVTSITIGGPQQAVIQCGVGISFLLYAYSMRHQEEKISIQERSNFSDFKIDNSNIIKAERMKDRKRL